MENSAIDQTAATEARADFATDLAPFSLACDALAKRMIDSKSRIPTLACILVQADLAGTVTLTATDLDMQASVVLPARVDSPGAVAIDAAALSGALAKARKGNKDGELRITDSDSRAVVKSGRNRFSMPTLPADDFPRLDLVPAAPLSAFTMPAGQLLADLAALAPCVAKDTDLGRRAFLCGVSLAVTELAGQDRLAMVASDGRNIAVASRALPHGAESLPGSILPGAAIKALAALAKLTGGAGDMAIERTEKPRLRFTLANVSLLTKLIDADYPAWERIFTGALAPIEATPALFPELLPGAPVTTIEAIAKAAPGPVSWERAARGFVGTVAGDDGLLFGACEDLSGEPVKGFKFERVGDADAQAYLESLASSRDLPSAADIAARCEAINAEYGEPDNAAYNNLRPFGEAKSDGAKLITRGNIVFGLTVAGKHRRAGWRETVQCWETLAEREIHHDAETVPVEGSYSIVMPAAGPQLAWDAPHHVDCADGHRYLITDNGSKLHMSAEQVRALIGESCFETMAITMPDGSSAFILQWLWEQGDTRFLTVRADGRTYPGAPYVTRAEIEAGPVVVAAAEIEPVSAPEPLAPVMVAEPAAVALCEPEIEELAPVEVQPDLVAALLARIEAIEAQLATPQPAEASPAPVAAIQPKRTPAHERAVRRAWAERKARRGQRFMLQLRSDQLANADSGRRRWMKECEATGERLRSSEAKRRRSTILARQRGQEMGKLATIIHDQSAQIDRAKLAQIELTELRAIMAKMRQPVQLTNVQPLRADQPAPQSADVRRIQCVMIAA